MIMVDPKICYIKKNGTIHQENTTVFKGQESNNIAPNAEGNIVAMTQRNGNIAEYKHCCSDTEKWKHCKNKEEM